MATRVWRGNAIPVAQVDTITVALTWATADTCTLTINGKDLVLTVGTDATTANVATAIKEMVNGDAQTGTGDHTFSETGDNVGEFNEITATVSGSVVTLTGDTKGKPFTLSVTESTAGDGTATEATATAATGPNHWDNADNWSGATVPVSTDDVVLTNNSVPVKYGLAQSAVTLTSLTVERTYTGTIGLPRTNTDTSGKPYDEYRATYLAISATTVDIGEGDDTNAAGSGRIKLDTGSNATTVSVYGTGAPAEPGIKAMLWKGTHASNVVNVLRGSFAAAQFDDETATIATLRVGYVSQILSDSDVFCGSGVTLTTIDKSGGKLETNSAATTYTQTDGESTFRSGALTTLTIDGGTVYYTSTGTVTTLNVSTGGTFDTSRDQRARTVTNANRYGTGRILDPFKSVTWTNGIDLHRSGLDSPNIDLGEHVTITPSAV